MFALLSLTIGCKDVQVSAEEKLVFQYSEGIQSLHQPTYDDFFLACHADSEEKDLSARMAGYESTRKGGLISFSPDGVEVIKLAALGRGAYFKVGRIRREGSRLQFRTTVKPDYVAINYAEFPPGAILYLMGEPLGKVISLKPGTTHGPPRSVLKSIDLHWIWTRNTLGRAEWCLESVAPVPTSERFEPLHFNEGAQPNADKPEAARRF